MKVLLIFLTSLSCLFAFSGVHAASMANPASMKCLLNGASYVLRTNVDGTQYGECSFPMGNICEEWAYYYGKCLPYKDGSTVGLVESPNVDIHGCVSALGYSWSGATSKCVLSLEKYTINVESPPTSNLRLNTMMQKYANMNILNFRRDADALIEKYALVGKTNYELNISYTLVNTGNIISVYMDTYTYLGGNNGVSNRKTYTYNTSSERLIGLFQVISHVNLTALGNKLEEEFNKTYSGLTTPDWIRSGTSARKWTNYERFTFQTDEMNAAQFINFYFKDNQIGPNTISPPIVSVSLPYAQIAGIH